jgi:hypothetical protein
MKSIEVSMSNITEEKKDLIKNVLFGIWILVLVFLMGLNINKEVIESFRGELLGYLFSGPMIYFLILGYSIRRELQGLSRGRFFLVGLRSGYLFQGCFASSYIVKGGASNSSSVEFLCLLILLVSESCLYRLRISKKIKTINIHFLKKRMIVLLTFFVTVVVAYTFISSVIYKEKQHKTFRGQRGMPNHK